LYLVRYKRERVRLLNREAVTQFLVWSDKRFIQTQGLAGKVFFEHLLNKHKIIVSDYTQTLAGMRFWQNRIKEALDKNLFVYSVNSQHEKVIRIKDWLDLQNYSTHWRDEKLGKLYRFAISSEELEERL
jgi:uncharacterized protein Usg